MAPLLPLLIAFALSTAILASPHGSRNLYAHPHRALAQRTPVDVHADAPSLPLSPPRKRSLNKRCIPRPSNATTSSTPLPSPTAPQNVAGAPSSPPYSSPSPSTPTPTPTTSTLPQSTPTSSPPPAQTSSSSGSGGSSGGGAAGFLTGLQFGFGTFYDTGLGSCGQTNTNSDYIVAVSETLYDVYPGYSGVNPNTNPVCGRKVQISYMTASITATVVDRCTGCRNQTSLDLSPSAFSALAPQTLGIIPITWQWV